jgi:phage baseplate assembly protein W
MSNKIVKIGSSSSTKN